MQFTVDSAAFNKRSLPVSVDGLPVHWSSGSARQSGTVIETTRKAMIHSRTDPELDIQLGQTRHVDLPGSKVVLLGLSSP